MNLYDRAVYGRRKGFVYLRYVAAAFFFLAQVATYHVVLNILERANDALQAFNEADVVSLINAVMSFKLSGAFGTFITVLRGLGALVIPLYFIATVSFVFNLNSGSIVKTTNRTALFSVLLFVAEFLFYAIIVATVTGIVFTVLRDISAQLSEQYEDILPYVDKLLAAINSEGAIIPADTVDGLIDWAGNFISIKLSMILLRNIPSFNIFLDLLLCLLMCIFFCTRPKWADTRAKLVLFRAIGILPAAYIAAAFVMNGLMQSGVLFPNIIMLSLFPAKRLPHFIFIVCIILCTRARPVRRLSTGKNMVVVYRDKKMYRATPLAYELPAEAKKRALQAAIYLSVCLALLCAADYVCGYLPYAAKWGLGKSYFAAACIPFLFFYDDRKPASKKSYNVFSAVYALVIASIVLIYLFY